MQNKTTTTKKKHRKRLGTKLIKSLWALAIFQLSDNEELFDRIRKVQNQRNE